MIRIPSFESFGKHIDHNIISMLNTRKNSHATKDLKLIKEKNESRNIVSEIKKPKNSKIFNSNAQTNRNRDLSMSDLKSDASNSTKNNKYIHQTKRPNPRLPLRKRNNSIRSP